MAFAVLLDWLLSSWTPFPSTSDFKAPFPDCSLSNAQQARQTRLGFESVVVVTVNFLFEHLLQATQGQIDFSILLLKFRILFWTYYSTCRTSISLLHECKGLSTIHAFLYRVRFQESEMTFGFIFYLRFFNFIYLCFILPFSVSVDLMISIFSFSPILSDDFLLKSSLMATNRAVTHSSFSARVLK